MSLAITLADANILVSRTLRDYFVYAAKLGAIDIRWSEQILDETKRNLIKSFGFTPGDADTLIERLSLYLPTALIEVKSRDLELVSTVEMDDKDRHVLAAALSGEAELLLTQNVDDFPTAWMAERGMELVTSGSLLVRLAVQYPEVLIEAHRIGIESRPQTEEQVLAILGRVAGAEAVRAVRSALRAEP